MTEEYDSRSFRQCGAKAERRAIAQRHDVGEALRQADCERRLRRRTASHGELGGCASQRLMSWHLARQWTVTGNLPGQREIKAGIFQYPYNQVWIKNAPAA